MTSGQPALVNELALVNDSATIRLVNVDELAWDRDGLIPAVAQDVVSGQVLMVAWMSRESLRLTLVQGRAVYWSRSRAELWRKGDTSGHVQLVRQVLLDCDADTLLLLVEQTGAACHTGTRACFDTIVTLDNPKAGTTDAR